jgi:hypothetical protein
MINFSIGCEVYRIPVWQRVSSPVFWRVAGPDESACAALPKEIDDMNVAPYFPHC